MRTNLQLINIHILGGDRSTRKGIIFSLTLLLPDLSAMGTSTNVLLQEKHHHCLFKRASYVKILVISSFPLCYSHLHIYTSNTEARSILNVVQII